MAEEKASSLTQEQIIQMVDDGLFNAARELGLQAAKHENCIMTGLNLLHFNAVTTQVQGAQGTWVGAAIDVEARVKDPFGYAAVIRHLVNGIGKTAEEAIIAATRNWAEGALPSLCMLFGVKHGQMMGTLKINSYTEGDVEATEWEGFVGPVQYWGDDNLRQVVNAGTPYGLVNQPLTNYLHEKTLHWVKVFGVRHPSGEIEFTVAIDNQIDSYACRVAEANFDWTPFPQPCSFRQFFVVRPKGSVPIEANERLAQAMKEHNIDTTPRTQRQAANQPQAQTQKKPSGWFPFGRRRQ